MNKLYTYLYFFLLLLLASCTDQEIGSPTTCLPSGQYRFSVTIPEPMETTTRALGDRPQNVTDMPLRVLVFDENGFFLAFEEATVESFDNESQTGTYTVNLPKSNTPCTLHFVLGLDNADYGGTVTPSDSETSIFSQLSVSGNKDAYWQRIVLDHVNDDTALPTVSLVRNFVQISVEDNSTDFELTGFAIVNERTAGTVAPYTGNEETGGFASFALENTEETNVYEQFTTLNPGFGGNNAGYVMDNAPTEDEFTPDDKFVYERNQDDSSLPAYMLVKGNYDGNAYYYKLDLVSPDADGMTTYLNLYRNFHYTIRINNVTTVGYTTIQGAMEGVASNNIGASIEVSKVNTIRDGIDQLHVSTLDTLLVDQQEAYIYYTFTENIDTDRENVNNGRVRIIPIDGLNTEVIASYDDDTPGVLKITPATLPDLMAEQEFAVVVDGSGLSRRIRVRVRQPFRFDAVDCEELVPDEVNSNLNLTVRLPQNMPSSVFPLTLSIEPKRKTLYPNAGVNQLPVQIGKEYTYTYLATVDYESYLDDPAFQYAFLTNMSESATFITVTNPYFVNEAEDFDYNPETEEDATGFPYNVTKFRNDERYWFFDVSLKNDERGNFVGIPSADDPTTADKGALTFYDSPYDNYGNTVTLRFSLHYENDVFDTPHPPVEIYADYFDWTNVQTTTGTFTVRENQECILYIPDDATNEQVLTFTINSHYAEDQIQLSSYDHETALVGMNLPDLNVDFFYITTDRWGNETTNEANNASISIEQRTNGGGWADVETINTGWNNNTYNLKSYIIGKDPNTEFRFTYTRGNWMNRQTYTAIMRIEELVDSQQVDMREE